MLQTRLTERFGLDHPVISAPMGFAGGGNLAAAVTAAGGLGLIGGGYGDESWLREQIAASRRHPVTSADLDRDLTIARPPERAERVRRRRRPRRQCRSRPRSGS